MLVARDEFDAFLRTPADTLTDIQRAARFYYISKASFGARIKSPRFGIAATAAPRINLRRIEEELSQTHLRLARVWMETKPYGGVIDRFDRKDTLFYLDPPYWGCETDYGEGIFNRADFTKLAEQLAGIKGRFILSLNDLPDVRSTFANFQIEPVQVRYSISATAAPMANELLISNFKTKALPDPKPRRR